MEFDAVFWLSGSGYITQPMPKKKNYVTEMLRMVRLMGNVIVFTLRKTTKTK